METIDTGTLINSRKVGGFQILVGVLGGCALFVEGFNTTVIAYIVPQIARAWQLSSDTVGVILSADLFGLLFGYLCLSPLSARFGHKRMVVLCTAAFGGFTFLTLTASGVAMLVVFRVLTGLGVGGAMPSAVALTGEYFPERMRSTSITLMYTGYSVGQILAGTASGLLLAPYGWQAVVACGGIVTLLFAAAFVFALPESLEYMINRGGAQEQARATLQRIAPDANIERAQLVAGKQGGRAVTIGQLLQDGRAFGTALIWTGMFMNLAIYFFLQKWLPSLLVMVGMTQAAATEATQISLAGGILAAFILGPAMDRFGPYPVVASLFAISALACVGMASMLGMPESIAILAAALAVGFCLSGGQKVNNALTVYFYPTALRGTGLGWALGIGRIGGFLCPLLAGQLLTMGWTPAGLFYASAGPMLLGAAAIWTMGQFYAHGAGARPLAESHKV